MRKRIQLVRSRGNVIRDPETRMVKLFAYVQCTEDWTDWMFQSVSLQRAAAMVARGDAERITRLHDGVVKVVGYRRTQPVRERKRTACTLTLGTLKAVANAVGKPSAVRLEPWEQRQVDKVLAWPLVGDTRAVAVRPRISERDRRAAETMLGMARGSSLLQAAA